MAQKTKRSLDEDVFSILNIKFLCEDENIIVYQVKYDLQRTLGTTVSTILLGEGLPWKQLVNMLAVD